MSTLSEQVVSEEQTNFMDLENWRELSAIFKKDAHPDKIIVLFYTNPGCGFCLDAEKEFRSLSKSISTALFVRLDIKKPGRESIFAVPGTMLGRELKGTPTYFVYKETKHIADVVGAGKIEELRSLVTSNL